MFPQFSIINHLSYLRRYFCEIQFIIRDKMPEVSTIAPDSFFLTTKKFPTLSENVLARELYKALTLRNSPPSKLGFLAFLL